MKFIILWSFKFQNFINDENGQAMTEYALTTMLVALTFITTARLLKEGFVTLWKNLMKFLRR
ncbi:MAG: hypothetical protein KAS39_07530, partial [Actinomycetia bacterium]|nr:hypothetical protein [Actinomycetes bacterium]